MPLPRPSARPAPGQLGVLLIGLTCLINTPAFAQDLEIGAFYGQRFGGTIGTATFGGSEITDLDVSEGDAYGMTVEFTLPNSWRMEFIWDSQDSYLNGNLDGSGKTRLASTTVDNYLFGGNYYFSQEKKKIRAAPLI